MAVSWRTSLEKGLRNRNEYVRLFLAEFLGSFVLVFMLDAMAANATFGGMLPGGGKRANFHHDHVQLALGAGCAVLIAVLACGGVSGAHLNPALSVAFAFLGHLHWKKLIVYLVAQYSGAFLASVGIFGIYRNSIDLYDGGVRNVTGETGTAGIFATYPAGEHITWVTAFCDQIAATAVLMGGVLAIVDQRNWQVPKHMVPLYIAFLIISIVLSLGYNTGAAMNPARDLMPRLFTYIAGWGEGTFSFWHYNWFWIPVIGSHLGAILGAIIYQGFVGLHWPEEKSYDMKADNLNLSPIRTPNKSSEGMYKVRYGDIATPANENGDSSNTRLLSSNFSSA